MSMTSEPLIFIYADKQKVMQYLDGGNLVPVESLADWQIRRRHILANMQLVMGEMPEAKRRVPFDLEVIDEVLERDCVRQKITFAVEQDDRVWAYRFLPRSKAGKVPGILCLHQTIDIGKSEPAGLGGSENLHYAKELAQRGYVTIAPDYPGFGDYKNDAYGKGYVSATMKGIWNHRRALDVLQSFPEVAGDRLGCIGHSLGGHNALFLAAFDERVKVSVTSCGFNSFFKYMGGDLSGWSHKGYMPRIAERYAKDPAKMPFDFTEVIAAIAPRAVFISAPVDDANFEISGVQDCIGAARPVYELYGRSGQLTALHPDCGHDFPQTARQAAYRLIDRVLAKE